MRTGCCNLEQILGYRSGLDVDNLAGLHVEGRTVDDAAIDHDVPVHNGLTSLGNGASETSAQYQSV